MTRANPTPTPRPAPGGAAVRRWLDRYWALGAYLALVALLAGGVAVTEGVVNPLLRLAVAVVAVTALVLGIRWQRPDATSGWWLIAAGAAVAAARLAAITTERAAGGTTDDWGFLFLTTLQYPFLIAGLLALARLGGRTKTNDQLDALMIALATFLVLFALVIHPVLPDGGLALAVGVLLPLGVLLLLAMVIRLALSVGLPTVAFGLLLLAMVTSVAHTVSLLVPTLTTGVPGGSWATRPLGLLFFMLLGAAALHPSLAHTRYRSRPPEDGVSQRRVALLALLAVVTPVALVAEVREASGMETVGITLPLVAAGGLLILLVGRLGLTAHVAQRKATEAARRSQDLAEAIQEQEALQQQLRYQAMHDPLTGLANRIVLTERMEWALTRPSGSRQHALALFDLDRFKDVNDTLGHPAGDELLVDVSHRLLAATPPGGTLARLGGDEFAVLLEDTSATQAHAWAERARRSIRQPYRVGGQELHLSTSVGLLTTNPAGPSPTAADALRDADLALYSAKAAGRNQVTQFRPELRTARLNLTRLSAGLRRALANQELTMHYQPVVNLTTGAVVAVEALLRWQADDRPAVLPADFIPVAEETGLILPIGTWALRQAVRDARPWHEQHGVSVAVNVSPRQLEDPGFADLTLGALRDAGLPGEGLIVEITESSLIATAAATETMNQLDRLRSHGVKVAIDDFGTGYSSLAYVSRLPVDIVKLDSSFVQHSHPPGSGDQGWAFTRAILHMVEALRLQAVAEGVETLEQAEALRELHCQLVQGFLYGRPMPRELVGRSISAWDGPAGRRPPAD